MPGNTVLPDNWYFESKAAGSATRHTDDTSAGELDIDRAVNGLPAWEKSVEQADKQIRIHVVSDPLWAPTQEEWNRYRDLLPAGKVFMVDNDKLVEVSHYREFQLYHPSLKAQALQRRQVYEIADRQGFPAREVLVFDYWERACAAIRLWPEETLTRAATSHLVDYKDKPWFKPNSQRLQKLQPDEPLPHIFLRDFEGVSTEQFKIIVEDMPAGQPIALSAMGPFYPKWSIFHTGITVFFKVKGLYADKGYQNIKPLELSDPLFFAYQLWVERPKSVNVLSASRVYLHGSQYLSPADISHIPSQTQTVIAEGSFNVSSSIGENHVTSLEICNTYLGKSKDHWKGLGRLLPHLTAVSVGEGVGSVPVLQILKNLPALQSLECHQWKRKKPPIARSKLSSTLTRLVMSDVTDMASVIALLSRLPHLKHLELTLGIPDDESAGEAAVTQVHLPELEVLSVEKRKDVPSADSQESNATRLVGHLLKSSTQLQKLKVWNLRGRFEWRETVLFPHLRSLLLSGDDYAFGLAGFLVAHAPHLEKIEFEVVGTQWPDPSSYFGSEWAALHLPSLRHLKVQTESALSHSDSTLVSTMVAYLFPAAPSVEHLTLQGCSLFPWLEAGKVFSLHPRLKTVEIINSVLGEKALAEWLATTPQLTQLTLRHCKRIEDDTYRGEVPAFSLPLLENLSITMREEGEFIGHQFLSTLIGRLPRLRELILENVNLRSDGWNRQNCSLRPAVEKLKVIRLQDGNSGAYPNQDFCMVFEQASRVTCSGGVFHSDFPCSRLEATIFSRAKTVVFENDSVIHSLGMSGPTCHEAYHFSRLSALDFYSLHQNALTNQTSPQLRQVIIGELCAQEVSVPGKNHAIFPPMPEERIFPPQIKEGQFHPHSAYQHIQSLAVTLDDSLAWTSDQRYEVTARLAQYTGLRRLYVEGQFNWMKEVERDEFSGSGKTMPWFFPHLEVFHCDVIHQLEDIDQALFAFNPEKLRYLWVNFRSVLNDKYEFSVVRVRKDIEERVLARLKRCRVEITGCRADLVEEWSKAFPHLQIKHIAGDGASKEPSPAAPLAPRSADAETKWPEGRRVPIPGGGGRRYPDFGEGLRYREDEQHPLDGRVGAATDDPPLTVQAIFAASDPRANTCHPLACRGVLFDHLVCDPVTGSLSLALSPQEWEIVPMAISLPHRNAAGVSLLEEKMLDALYEGLNKTEYSYRQLRIENAKKGAVFPLPDQMPNEPLKTILFCKNVYVERCAALGQYRLHLTADVPYLLFKWIALAPQANVKTYQEKARRLPDLALSEARTIFQGIVFEEKLTPGQGPTLVQQNSVSVEPDKVFAAALEVLATFEPLENPKLLQDLSGLVGFRLLNQLNKLGTGSCRHRAIYLAALIEALKKAHPTWKTTYRVSRIPGHMELEYSLDSGVTWQRAREGGYPSNTQVEAPAGAHVAGVRAGPGPWSAGIEAMTFWEEIQRLAREEEERRWRPGEPRSLPMPSEPHHLRDDKSVESKRRGRSRRETKDREDQTVEQEVGLSLTPMADPKPVASMPAPPSVYDTMHAALGTHADQRRHFLIACQDETQRTQVMAHVWQRHASRGGVTAYVPVVSDALSLTTRVHEGQTYAVKSETVQTLQAMTTTAGPGGPPAGLVILPVDTLQELFSVYNLLDDRHEWLGVRLPIDTIIAVFILPSLWLELGEDAFSRFTHVPSHAQDVWKLPASAVLPLKVNEEEKTAVVEDPATAVTLHVWDPQSAYKTITGKDRFSYDEKSKNPRVTFEPSDLTQDVTKVQSLTLCGVEVNRHSLAFLLPMMEENQVFFNGAWHDLHRDFHCRLAPLPKQAARQDITYRRLTTKNRAHCQLVLNKGTLGYFLPGYSSHEGHLSYDEGLLKAYAGKSLGLLISQSLKEADLNAFFEAAARHGVMLTFYLAEGVKIEGVTVPVEEEKAARSPAALLPPAEVKAEVAPRVAAGAASAVGTATPVAAPARPTSLLKTAADFPQGLSVISSVSFARDFALAKALKADVVFGVSSLQRTADWLGKSQVSVTKKPAEAKACSEAVRESKAAAASHVLESKASPTAVNEVTAENAVCVDSLEASKGEAVSLNFTLIPSQLAARLVKGETIIVIGPAPERIAHQLQSLGLSDPCLIINRQREKIKGRLIFITKEVTSFLGVCPVIMPSQLPPVALDEVKRLPPAVPKQPENAADEQALRCAQLEAALSRYPFVAIEGPPAIGKSTTVRHFMGERGYEGLDQLPVCVAAALADSCHRYVLFLDEATFLAQGALSGFSSAFYGGHLLVEGKPIPWPQNLSVIAAYNPTNQKGGRLDHTLLAEHPECVIRFAPFSPAYLKNFVFLPLLERLLPKVPASQRDKLADGFLSTEKITGKKEVLRQQLHMVLTCALYVDEKGQPHPPFKTIEALGRFVAYETLMPLLSAEEQRVLYAAYWEKDEKAYAQAARALDEPTTKAFKQKQAANPDAPFAKQVLTESRHRALRKRSEHLQQRKWRQALAKDFPLLSYQGIRGYRSEGPSGIGKTEEIIAQLEAEGFQNLATAPAGTPMEVCYVLATRENTRHLQQWFHEGLVVVFNELSTFELIENELNPLLTGVDAKGQRARKEGFLAFATDNASSNGGRVKLSDALKSRFETHQTAYLPRREVVEVMMHKGFEEKAIHRVLDHFEKNKKPWNLRKIEAFLKNPEKMKLLPLAPASRQVVAPDSVDEKYSVASEASHLSDEKGLGAGAEVSAAPRVDEKISVASLVSYFGDGREGDKRATKVTQFEDGKKLATILAELTGLTEGMQGEAACRAILKQMDLLDRVIGEIAIKQTSPEEKDHLYTRRYGRCPFFTSNEAVYTATQQKQIGIAKEVYLVALKCYWDARQQGADRASLERLHTTLKTRVDNSALLNFQRASFQFMQRAETNTVQKARAIIALPAAGPTP